MEETYKTIIIMFIPTAILLALLIWQFVTYEKRKKEYYKQLWIDDWVATITDLTDSYYTVENKYEGSGFVVVKRFYEYPKHRVCVRNFNDTDIDYARRCAEELCDKLNETI